MAKAVRRKGVREKVRHSLKVEGFMRLQIMDYDKDGNPTIVAGDSGWCGPNLITNIGFMNYINNLMGSTTGSLFASYAAVGTGSDPAATDGSLPSEAAVNRKVLAYVAVNSTKIRWTATWQSSDQTTGGNIIVKNAGLFYHTSAQSLMCGKSFATSSWGTNQALNLSYELNLS